MISIEPKLEAIHKGFAEVSDVLRPDKLDKYILSRLGAGVKSQARRAIKGLVQQRTGNMYKGVYTYFNRAKKTQIVTNSAQRGEGPKAGRYPWILATGHRKDPRSGRVLTFGVRDWVEGPGKRYLWSEKADDDIEKVLNRELEKLKKKGVLA